MVKEKDSVTQERVFAKHARIDLINLLDIWAQELESVTTVQVAEDKESGKRKRQLKEEIACRQTYLSAERKKSQALEMHHYADRPEQKHGECG